jgi:outer membrane protein TolC
VSKSYFGAVLAKERIRLQEDLLKKFQLALNDARVLFENGLITKLELQRAEWNVKNHQAEIQKAKQTYEQSLYLLKYQMGISGDSIVLLEDATLTSASTAVPAFSSGSPETRSEYKIIRIQLTQERLNARRFKMSYLPSLNAYGYLGTQSFRPDIDFFSTSSKWYGVSYVGLKLSVPVFDGLLKSKQLQESRIQEEKKTNELSAFEKQYAFEIENAKRGVLNSAQILEIRKNNLEYSMEQYKNAEIKFQQGILTLKDLTESSSMINEAQNSYLSALHDLMVSNLEFERVK